MRDETAFPARSKMQSIANGLVSRFRVADRGNIAVISAIAMSAVIGASGLTILYLQATERKTSVQAGLDAGVLAGTALSYSATDDERIAAAEAAFYANSKGGLFLPDEASADFEADSTKPVFSVAKAEVSGVAVTSVENGLASILGIGKMNVKVSAMAAKRMSDPVCMLALNDSNPSSIFAYGNAEIKAEDCAIQANSSSGEGLNIQGMKSSVSAEMIGVTGSYGGTNYTPKPMTDIAPVPDPYADLPVPEAGACTDTSSKLNNVVSTLDPGTYCGGLEIKSGAIVKLNPGLYIMQDGPFKVNSGAQVRGDEVMIALTGSNSVLSLQSDSFVKVSSPMTGTYRNIQFMSDRDLSESKFEEEWSTILSGARLEYDGVMYLPEQNFWISGTGHEAVVKGSSPSMILLVDTAWVQGNAVMDLKREDKRGVGDDPARMGFTYGAMLIK